MSWLLRSAVNKAVDARKKNRGNLSLIRDVAGSVVQQAGHVVVGGANLIQDRIGKKNVQSFKHAVKRLEEVAISSRGEERILLLRRWLVSLKQTKRKSNVGIDEDSHIDEDYEGEPTLVTYYDSDHGRENLNFRDVFLHSQALERIVLSMILEAPNEEEIALLVEIFRLTLMGGKEVHTAIISSMQDLAKVFSSYQDEVLMKREEFLQYAQVAVTGLKMSAEDARIDLEVSTLKTKFNPSELELQSGKEYEYLFQANAEITIEGLKKALSVIRAYSKMEALLLEKKAIRNSESPENHSQKVDKLKILSESLANSTSKAEKRILDHRSQKEEALHFRLAKATEASQIEKEMVAEIEVLEKQKDELEMELKKVNTSLNAARTRLRNAREERDQFYDASNEFLQHLQTKGEELSRSIASYRTEANVVTSWIKFMEDSWGIRSSLAKQKEKQVNDELERNARLHADLIMQLLPAYEKGLDFSITRFRVLVRRLKLNDEEPNHNTESHKENPINGETLLVALNRKSLEEEYQDLESKLTNAFGLVENIKQTYTQSDSLLRQDEEKVRELLKGFEKMKEEFESIEKPNLQVNEDKSKQQLTWRGKPLKLPPKQTSERQQTITIIQEEYNKLGPVIDGRNFLDSEDPTPESDSAKHGKGHFGEEIIDWEFDALDT